MASVHSSKSAQADLDRVLHYLRDHAGERTAIEYEQKFEAAFDRLADHPQSGSPRPAFGKSVRIVVVEPYVAFYRYNRRENTVTIFRVLHGHRRTAAARMVAPRCRAA